MAEERELEIRVISGDIHTVGSIVEIPWAVGSLGHGPVYKVNPVTRQATKDLQRFRITAIVDGHPSLEPCE